MDPTFAAETLGYDQTGATVGSGAGIQGHSPLFSNGGSSVGEAVQDVWEWLNEPFTTPMSPIGIALIVGSILVAIILWNFVLYHVRIAAETL
jgi:hypothetical protein